VLVIQVKVQGPGRSAFFAMAITIVLFVSNQPVSVAVEVPVPLEVKLEDPEPVVVLENHGSVTVILNGSVETNYPGVELYIGLGATCGALTTQVSPSEMTIRGVTVKFFEIAVFIPSNITSGTGLYGRLLYSVLYTYPGGSAAATSSQTFVITVLRNNTINQTNESTQIASEKSDSRVFLDSICAMQVLLLAPVVLSIYYFHRHKKGRTPRVKAIN
jgi:hypothetical protein